MIYRIKKALKTYSQWSGTDAKFFYLILPEFKDCCKWQQSNLQMMSLRRGLSSNPGSRDLPGGPVVSTLPPNAGGAGLVPGQEMRSHRVWPKRKSHADSVAGAELQSYSLPQPFLAPSLNYHFHLFPQIYYLNVRGS